MNAHEHKFLCQEVLEQFPAEREVLLASKDVRNLLAAPAI